MRLGAPPIQFGVCDQFKAEPEINLKISHVAQWPMRTAEHLSTIRPLLRGLRMRGAWVLKDPCFSFTFSAGPSFLR